MDAEHPNAAAYRRAADAFRSGDLTLLCSLVDADVVWHVPGRHGMAGDIHGRDALLAWFGLLRPKGFWLSEHDVFGNDEHLCALSVVGARRDGVDVQTRVVSVFHYRDGQQLERWFYPDPASWEAIFADRSVGSGRPEPMSTPSRVHCLRYPSTGVFGHAWRLDGPNIMGHDRRYPRPGKYCECPRTDQRQHTSPLPTRTARVDRIRRGRGESHAYSATRAVDLWWLKEMLATITRLCMATS